MKKKLLVFTLCFTLIFSSLNYKKSYADGGIISLPMLATVSALAVGTGIVINNSDDLYDLGRKFFDYVDNHNDLTWSTVQVLFSSSVALLPGNLISVKSDFLDIVKGFFDDSFGSDREIVYGDTVVYPSFVPLVKGLATDTYRVVYKDSRTLTLELWSNKSKEFLPYFHYKTADVSHVSVEWQGERLVSWVIAPGESDATLHGSYHRATDFSHLAIFSGQVVFPYNGGYNWDNVGNRVDEGTGDLPLPIPGNLGNLVGQSSDDFWSNTDDLVGSGDISIPSVDNPSIGLGGSSSFGDSIANSPSTSVPNEGIWSTIKEFIISLVVPSDSFWTDTWGGLYNNFTSSFPMVDMDGFNDLVTGEKKFPNIDINIMGVNGRVVNGDVVNSIVDWLRPIVAGFMMLCLMLFNYRKIYKLIRNSEPFGSVASGNNSDIRTGISEYSKHEVVKATDMVAEYHAWRERGGK